MNKKLTLLIGIIALFAMKMNAQSDYKYGIYIGYGFNTMSINSDMYYDDSEVVTNMVIEENQITHEFDTSFVVRYMPVDNAKVETMPSFTIGGYYEIPVNDIVGLQLHLMYNRYGYTMTGVVNHLSITDNSLTVYGYKSTLKMSNIGAGLFLKFNVIQENLSVDVGVTPSYCIIMSKDVERGPLHKTMKYDSKDDYSAFNVCGSIGVTYYWYDVFFLSVKANLGLIDVLKSKEPYISQNDQNNIYYNYQDVKSRTNSVYATIGYRW